MACAALAATLGPFVGPARGADAAAAVNGPASFTVERDDRSSVAGLLRRITADELSIDTDEGPRMLPVASVRRVERVAREPAPSQPPEAALRLTLTGGATLTGADFSWDGGQAVLLCAAGRVELPADLVRTVEWLSPATDWTGSIPEATESDLIVIRKDDAFEFVECAITAVSADTISVVLDDEKIPVKRSKVIGLHWLRNAAPQEPAAVEVDVTAGTLRATAVEWTPDGLVLDGAIRLPAAMLDRIDFAAARTVSLATLAPERLDVEPYYGGLQTIDGLAAFFAPRAVPADRECPRPGLVVRPRTVAIWRLPVNSRRFRTSIEPAGTSTAPAAVVVVAVDDREVFRGPAAASTPVPISLDLTGARRLSLTVDFGSKGGSGAVRLAEPTIEK